MAENEVKEVVLEPGLYVSQDRDDASGCGRILLNDVWEGNATFKEDGDGRWWWDDDTGEEEDVYVMEMQSKHFEIASGEPPVRVELRRADTMASVARTLGLQDCLWWHNRCVACPKSCKGAGHVGECTGEKVEDTGDEDHPHSTAKELAL